MGCPPTPGPTSKNQVTIVVNRIKIDLLDNLNISAKVKRRNHVDKRRD